MKLNKLFLLGLTPILLLSACGTSQEVNPASSIDDVTNSTSSADVSNNSKISNAFKEAGEEMAYVAASKPRAKSLIDMPASDRLIQLATPSGIVYVVGKLYENEGFDCFNKVVEFREIYDMESGGPDSIMVADVTLSIMIDADIANNKAKLYANEIIDATEGDMHMYSDAYMFLEFDYNFTTNELGNFTAWNKADNYCHGSETPITGYNHAKRTGTEIKKLVN